MKNPAHERRDFERCLREVSKDCYSVLEPGCQFGTQLKRIWRPHMTGIEVHKPYLDRAWKAPHRSQIPRGSPAPPEVAYIHADALLEMEKIATQKPNSFDGVMMIDFIEHFERPNALRLVAWAEMIARKRIWLWLPEGNHPQDNDEWGLGGEYWQLHRSSWHAEDLQKLGYDVAVWAKHHPPKGPNFDTGALFAIKNLQPSSAPNA